MQYKDIILEKDGSVHIITLNRPEQLNAITQNLAEEEMPAALEEIEKDAETRVLVITGAGRGFCSGADLSTIDSFVSGRGTKRTRKAILEPLGFYTMLVRKLSKVVIAAVNGVAAGGGFSLALACDIRVASENAVFFPSFVRVGLSPDAGMSYYLPQVVGPSKALEILCVGEPIDASAAEKLGIVSKVVSHNDLMPTAMELARKIAAGAPIALALTKRAIYQALTGDIQSQFCVESHNQGICFKTQDFEEGMIAFKEKRLPHFTGK